MGKSTKIEWTATVHSDGTTSPGHTFSPWWGCQRVSPGCQQCYAETFSKRVGLKVWGPTVERRTFGDKHWREPMAWNKAAGIAGEQRRVFCASMADVFEDRRDLDAQRERLWALIAATPNLSWLLLTKRPECMTRLAPVAWAKAWPDNVWAGTTAEDQTRADERIPHLLRVPARVRFLSCEPLLGPVRLSCFGEQGRESGGPEGWITTDHHGIDWIICGGESGPGARPFDLAWAREMRDECKAAGVPFFFKQAGSLWARASAAHDGKGGHLDDLPEDLRVREFPR